MTARPDAAPGLAALALAARVLVACVLAACGRGNQEQAIRGAAQGDVTLPAPATLAAVPLGDWAGATPNTLARTIPNPYANDRAAALAGEQLFRQMNCADCHGYDLKGGMGPNLEDRYWRYGGSPAEIYNSIADGRPQGMPAWGKALTPDEIWRLVTYIQSFGGSFPAPLADRGRQGDLGDPMGQGNSSNRGNHMGEETR